MKNIIFAFAVLATSFASAQVGVGNTDPKATLDVNKASYTTGEQAGIAVTQQTGAQIEGMTTTDLKAGTLVYATSVGTGAITATGYWNWNGTAWEKISASAANLYNTDGTLTGNRTVNQGANNLTFTGTGKLFVNENTVIGATASTTTSKFSVVNETPNAFTIDLENYGNASTSIIFKNADGTALAPIAQQANKMFGGLFFVGHNGTSFAAASAQIGAVSEENFTSSALGTSLVFRTMKKGATSGITERMRISSEGNVGIGTSTPKSSALLDLTSTTQGFLPPRMTQIQLSSIVSPEEGLVVYCTNCNPKGLKVYYGSGWASSGSEVYIPLVEAKADFTSTLIGSVLTAHKVYTENGAGSEVSSTYKWYRANNKNGTGKTEISGETASNYTITASDVDKWIGVEISSTASNSQVGVSAIEWIPAQFTFNGKTYAATRGSYDGPDANTIGDYIWLDRNLGANQVATAFDDFNAFGDWYQWGRLADGHEAVTWTGILNSTVSGTTATQSTTDVPGNNLFISGVNNWRNPVNNTLWNAPNYVNSPAPAGFKVPEYTIFANESTTFPTQNMNGGFNSRLKLTAAGRRNTANALFERGASGYYKTASVTSATSTNGVVFSLTDVTLNTFNAKAQSEASSVRCVLID